MTPKKTSLVEMAYARGVFLVVFLCQVLCGVFAEENEVERGLRMLYKTYTHCEASGDIIPCLKLKAVKLADRALKINSIPLFEGMTVIKNEDADGRAFAGADFEENSLPSDPEAREETLDNILVDRVTRFLKTHSIQFGFPKVGDSPEAEDEEGRGRKKKKYIGHMLMAAMIKGGILTYATKMVGLLAAKALLVSKIALVVASMIAAKKLFSGSTAESKTIEIVQKPQISHSHAYSGDFGSLGGQGWEASASSGGGGSGGYARRSFDTSLPFPAAQELAYRGRARQ